MQCIYNINSNLSDSVISINQALGQLAVSHYLSFNQSKVRVRLDAR